MYILDWIMVPIQIIIFLFTVYYFLIGVNGLWRKKEKKILTPQKTFAVIVAAHNESAVIGQLVDNLKMLITVQIIQLRLHAIAELLFMNVLMIKNVVKALQWNGCLLDYLK